MSDQSASDGRVSRLAVLGWPLRRKVALALAIPLLLAATFGGLRVTNDLEQSSNASTSATQVTVLAPAINYLTAAEKGMVAAQSSVGISQAELEDALVEIRAAAEELERTRGEASLTFVQRRQVDVILDLSRALRDEATGPVSPDTWIAQLRQVQSGVTTLITTIINEQINPEPRLELLSQALSGRFALAQQQALTAGDRTGRTAEVALFAEFGAERVALDRLAGQAGVSDSSIQTLRTNNGQRAQDAGQIGGVLGSQDAFDEYDNLQGSLIAAVDQQLADDASAARNSALLNALLTLIALGAAIALALIISRSLVGPIRAVREGALKVARQDLPEAVDRIRAGAEPEPIKRIDVDTHEEVGQLARAVDDLHQQAVTLASGEARLRSQVGEMFVTLSRRNTTLINQQLNLIETLERDEEDPKRLESLFRLDHLASRMRRTSDSLLILADAPTRAAGWESVSIGETLQAATAGVTDYKRVRIESSLAVLVDESAAGDLVHLLTELVDNSLSYSSPHTTVSLATAETADGVAITVADAGLGIPVEELEQINQNLREGVEVTPDTARRMGLFVVSRLAQRHGIVVTLKANRGDGTTAYVSVPNAILPERAHLEPAVVEPEDHDVVPQIEVEEIASSDVEASPYALDTALPADDATDDPTTLPTPAATLRPAEPAVDQSDPLGLGESHLRPVGQGLPTRERGATIPHLTAAGVQLPVTDEDGNEEPEAPRELKRATGAMQLRSKRDLDAGLPPVAAVPDLPRESDESAGSEDVEFAEAAPAAEVVETFDSPSALDRPAEHEPINGFDTAEAEVIEPQTFEPQSFEPQIYEVPAFEAPVAEVPAFEAPVADVVGTEVLEPGLDEHMSPEEHIAALMAKIRPQRGRLPIPDYDDVDHAEILRAPVRERGALDGDPLSDPLTADFEEAAVEPGRDAWPAETTASLDSSSAYAAPTDSVSIGDETAEQPAWVAADTIDASRSITSNERDEEPAINGASRSSWLTNGDDDRAWSSTEVEAGWERADTVAATHEATNDAGLPVRRPGARLVPGSVTKPVGAAGRDPEAIRARLSAHKAGVRRGRTAPVTADDQ